MRLFELLPGWRPLVDEDCEALAAAADNTMRLARRQKAQSNIERTKSTLDAQKKRLSDIVKPKPPKAG